jgi:hypothetical protein
MPALNLNLHASSADRDRILAAYGKIYFTAENRAATEAELFTILATSIVNNVLGVEKRAAQEAVANPAPLTIT